MFNCFIETNGQKYNIIINNKENDIELSSILNELWKIPFKKIITFETHLFELFNTHFNEYVVIKSDKQMIKNWSEIRVSLKHKNDLDFKSINNKFISIKKEDKSNERLIKTNKLNPNKMSNSITGHEIKTCLIKDGLNDKSIKSQAIKNPFYYNYDTNSSLKRIVEENEDEVIDENNKRIKKEINNTVIPMKSCVKQETDLKLNNNLSQTIVNSFSLLSLSKTEIQSSIPSTSSLFNANSVLKTEPIDISFSSEDINEDLKRMTINSCDNSLNANNESINKSRKKKKKNKKSKKKVYLKKLKKLKKSKKGNNNEDKEKPRVGGHKNIWKSLVIKELKVTVNENSTQEVIDSLIALKNEGIVMKKRKKGNKYECLLCDNWFKSIQSAEEHVNCDNHLLSKTEQNFKGVDRIFVLDIGKYTDIEVILGRKRELQKFGIKLKQNCLSHGIRLKNGFGCSAYVCLRCNQWFDSLPDVRYHLEVYNKSYNVTVFDPVMAMNKLNID